MKKSFLSVRFHAIFVSLAFLLLLSNARADVRLPSVFGDHMVLQQQQKIRVWGWADAGESVVVTLGEHTAKATADDAGRWKVELPPMTASKMPMAFDREGQEHRRDQRRVDWRSLVVLGAVEYGMDGRLVHQCTGGDRGGEEPDDSSHQGSAGVVGRAAG